MDNGTANNAPSNNSDNQRKRKNSSPTPTQRKKRNIDASPLPPSSLPPFISRIISSATEHSKENASLKQQLRTTKAERDHFESEMARWKTRYERLQLSHVCAQITYGS